MSKEREKLVTLAAILKLERISLFLDTELEVTAKMSVEEVENNLREMGLAPYKPLPEKIRRLISEQARERQASSLSDGAEYAGQEALNQGIVMPAHVYVSDEPLQHECEGEVKRLILEIRHLTKQRRYKEALELAVEATQLDPNYWRAWISRGTLLVLFGKDDEGEKIFRQVLNDFSGNPKARAAALHGRAWLMERRYELNPPAKILREVSRLYEKALKLDETRANTRASLLICRKKLGEIDKFEKLQKESSFYEGFLDHLRFELTIRRAIEVWQSLSARLRRVLHDINSAPFGNFGYWELLTTKR
ncbi:MAG TPA: hypothetical protein VGC66_15410 [Pyrinomonadaceae bacterium]|jgi:tetratricopeptide (TPR) repeat protein